VPRKFNVESLFGKFFGTIGYICGDREKNIVN
jgi:hypothetical protein